MATGHRAPPVRFKNTQICQESPFFSRLNHDVRCLIYDFLYGTLPPTILRDNGDRRYEDSIGLIVSCQQAYEETRGPAERHVARCLQHYCNRTLDDLIFGVPGLENLVNRSKVVLETSPGPPIKRDSTSVLSHSMSIAIPGRFQGSKILSCSVHKFWDPKISSQHLGARTTEWNDSVTVFRDNPKDISGKLTELIGREMQDFIDETLPLSLKLASPFPWSRARPRDLPPKQMMIMDSNITWNLPSPVSTEVDDGQIMKGLRWSPSPRIIYKRQNRTTKVVPDPGIDLPLWFSVLTADMCVGQTHFIIPKTCLTSPPKAEMSHVDTLEGKGEDDYVPRSERRVVHNVEMHGMGNELIVKGMNKIEKDWRWWNGLPIISIWAPKDRRRTILLY